MALERITDDRMAGVIWENGALLDSEQGREPTQLERFHWIADEQLEADQAQIPAIERAAMERAKFIVLRAIAEEPGYPQDMPDELWIELDGNRLNTTKAMRGTVRLTKNNITDRFLEALKSELLGKGDKIKEGE